MKENAGGENNNIVYQESLDFALWFRLLLMVALLALLVLMVVSVLNGSALPAVLMVCVCIFMFLTLVNFWTLEFVVTETHVIFGFGFLKKVFPRARIVSCEAYQLRLKNYLALA